MKIIKAQEVRFDIDASSSSGTGTLSGFTSLSKMACIASWHVNSGESPTLGETAWVDVYPTSTTVVTAERFGSAAYACSVTAYVFEVDADTTLYKGTWAMTNAETSDAAVSIGGTVTLANTIGWHYRQNEGEAAPGDDWDPDGAWTRMSFASTTTLDFDRNAAKGECSGHWFVVESTDLTVEHVTKTLSGTDTSIDETITSVTTAETYLLGSYLTDNIAYNDEACFDVTLQDATTVEWQRAISAADDFDWYVMVVSDSNNTVQRGEFTADNVTTDSATITSTDRTRSIVKSGYGTSGWGANNKYEDGTCISHIDEMWLSADTTANLERGAVQGSSGGNRVTWEVVQFTVEAGSTRRVMVIS